jgi:hypothetical protein
MILEAPAVAWNRSRSGHAQDQGFQLRTGVALRSLEDGRPAGIEHTPNLGPGGNAKEPHDIVTINGQRRPALGKRRRHA